MPFKFIMSQKKKTLLVHEGNVFNYMLESSLGVTWRCVKYKNSNSLEKIQTTTKERNANILYYHKL